MKKPTFAERVARCADVFTIVNDRHREEAAGRSPPGADRAATRPGAGAERSPRPVSGPRK